MTTSVSPLSSPRYQSSPKEFPEERCQKDRPPTSESPKPNCLATFIDKSIEVSTYPISNLESSPELISRVLFLAQVIMSLIAIPFFLLLLIFSPAIACTIDQPIVDIAKGFAKLAYMHLHLIPTGLIGIFSKTLADKYVENCFPRN